MKYYLLFNMMYNDGTKDSNAVYTYDTADEAIAAFHKQLGGWMVKENVKHILALAINSEGGELRKEIFDRPEETHEMLEA